MKEVMTSVLIYKIIMHMEWNCNYYAYGMKLEATFGYTFCDGCVIICKNTGNEKKINLSNGMDMVVEGEVSH